MFLNSTKIVIKPTTAHLLEDKDLIGKMDPYIIFKLDGNKQKSRVHRSGGKRPIWKETFEFDVHPGKSDVRVTVKDKDRFKWDDHIGSCNVDLLEATQLGKSDLWYELFRKGKKAGSIHLIIASKEYMDNNSHELDPKSASGNTHSNTYGVPQGAMEQAFGDSAYKVHPSSTQSSAIYDDPPSSDRSSSYSNSLNNSSLMQGQPGLQSPGLLFGQQNIQNQLLIHGQRSLQSSILMFGHENRQNSGTVYTHQNPLKSSIMFNSGQGTYIKKTITSQQLIACSPISRFPGQVTAHELINPIPFHATSHKTIPVPEQQQVLRFSYHYSRRLQLTHSYSTPADH